MESDRSGAANKDLHNADTLADVRKAGYSPFSLGPVYVYAGVTESLIKKFSEEDKEDVSGRPRDGRYTLLSFEHAILTNCPGWENTLEVMDTRSYQWFKKWLMSLNFTNRVKKAFYLPRLFIGPLADPIAFGKRGKHVAEVVDIFGLSGMKGVLKPQDYAPSKVNVSTYIRLKVDPPEEDTQVLGRQMLNLIREA